MRKTSLIAGFALLGLAPLALAAEVPAGTYAELGPDDDVITGTYSVEGALGINGAAFTPTLLTVFGDNAPTGGGRRNGEVYFDAGAIAPVEISTSGASTIFVNTGASTQKLTLGSGTELRVGAQFDVTGDDGVLTANSADITVALGQTLSADTYVGTGTTTLRGRGTLAAGAFTHAGYLRPGDDENELGQLNIVAPSVSFADSVYQVSVLDSGSGFESDLISVTGAVTEGGLLFVDDVYDMDGLLSEGDMFLVIDASADITSLSGFSAIGTVYDADDNIVGEFAPVLQDGNVYVQVTAVPEPAMIGLLGVAALGLRRRRA